VAYRHPLAFLLGLQGVALLRAIAGDDGFDADFVQARLAEVARMVTARELADGVAVGDVDTVGGYRIWADYYDVDDNPLLPVEQPVVQGILAGLPVGRALDAACGTGRHSRYLTQLGHRVVGVDTSMDMLAKARAAAPDVLFCQGDLHALPVGDRAVDLVVCALALAHVPQLTGVFAEFARVLSPGGHLVVSDLHVLSRYLGGVPTVTQPDGRITALPSYSHLASDYLAAAFAGGLSVRHCAEPVWPPNPYAGGGHAQQWCPEAAAAAYEATPAAVVWLFQRERGSTNAHEVSILPSGLSRTEESSC
jgi:SAM-dependent methyltransferase